LALRLVTAHSRCATSLLPLRGISRTYRLTNKPVPTRHSYYVPNVLKPLQVSNTHTLHCVNEL
jgi:hypothetical protein